MENGTFDCECRFNCTLLGLILCLECPVRLLLVDMWRVTSNHSISGAIGTRGRLAVGGINGIPCTFSCIVISILVVTPAL